MRGCTLCFLLLCMTMLSACSGAPARDRKQLLDVSGDYKIGRPYEISGVWYYPHHDPGYDEIGIASWYGPGFHGKSTASGEIYDQNALTAAHPTLPLPVIVRVTHLENGRSLLLRVNDRGPFVDGRIIDVSRSAAERLGFRHQGLAWVRVQYVSGGPSGDINQLASAPGPVREREAASDARLFVQTNAVKDYANAAALRDRLRRFGYSGIDLVQVNGTTNYRLRIGPWNDRETADAMLQGIISRGLAHARVIAEDDRFAGDEELLLLR